MANVSIKFNGKEFLLSCEDGQEEHLEELLIQINQKFNNLKNDLGNLGENKLLLITAVKVMDEYYETKKKVDQKKDELKELSNKFKELKSLIYEYRDRKEDEISELNQNHKKLKDEIEINQKNYEKIIDEATEEITSFVEKANLEKLS
jgi:cell division protein ZapA|tara:strand:+ start:55 stop:498 length:444 start_codon:yes stop_codon:yes gene_type:complete